MVSLTRNSAPVNIQEEVSQAMDTEYEPRGGRSSILLSLTDMYRSLIIADGEVNDDYLLPHHRPMKMVMDDSRTIYTSDRSREFLRDFESTLESLPGVRRGHQSWEFIGVRDSDDTETLNELMSREDVLVEKSMDELLIPRHSNERESIHHDFERLKAGRLKSPRSDHFVEMPFVEEVDDSLKPNDIEIETYADVLEAEKRMERDTGAVRWEFNE